MYLHSLIYFVVMKRHAAVQPSFQSERSQQGIDSYLRDTPGGGCFDVSSGLLALGCSTRKAQTNFVSLTNGSKLELLPAPG